MSHHAKAFALVVFAILAGCGHSGTVPGTPPSSTTNASFSQNAALPFVTTGNFTEYKLPAGVNPSDLTRGPSNTVYFVNGGGAAKLYQLKDATGHVTVFPAPAPYEVWGTGITPYNNSIVYVVVNHNIPQDAFYFANVATTGHYSFTGAPYFEFSPPTNLVLGADGHIWLGYCIDPCESSDDGAVNGTRLTDFFAPHAITPGPGGNIYAASESYGPPTPESDSRVYVISLSGAILHTYVLPNFTDSTGITTGPDHNLWITAQGINKILRMTPSGSVTQFSLPTANAGPARIVSSYDGALFFTESNANKIGRITTSGHVTEYRIPTANSQPTGITPCSPTHCGIHGGVWFTETNANKIGKFNAPT